MNKNTTARYYQTTLFSMLLLLLVGCGGGSNSNNNNNNEQGYSTFAKSYGGDFNDNIASVKDIERENQSKFIISGNLSQQYRYDAQTIGLKNKSGVINTGALWLSELDTNGNLLSHKGYSNSLLSGTSSDLVFDQVEPTMGSGYWLAGSQTATSSAGQELVVKRVDVTGNTIWNKSFPEITPLDVSRLNIPDDGWAVTVTDTESTSNGELLLSVKLYATVNEPTGNGAFRIQSEFNLLLLRIGADGNLLWTTTLLSRAENHFDFYPVKISEVSDGTIVIGLGTQLLGISSGGARLWQKEENWRQISTTPDGLILVLSDLASDPSNSYLKRIDTQGNLIKSVNIGRSVGYNGYAESCDPVSHNNCKFIHPFKNTTNNVVQLIDFETEVRLSTFELDPYCERVIDTHYDAQADEYHVMCWASSSSDVVLLSFSPTLSLKSNISIPPNRGESTAAGYAFYNTELLFVDRGGAVFENIGDILFVDRWQLNGNGVLTPQSTLVLTPGHIAKSVVSGLTANADSSFILLNVKGVEDDASTAISSGQSILHLNANGAIQWQKKWEMRMPFLDLPSATLMNQASDSLLVYGFDSDNSWGGLLSFSVNDGSVSTGVNVIPPEIRETTDPFIASNEKSVFLASTTLDDLFVKDVWVTRLNLDGEIVWQYLYKPGLTSQVANYLPNSSYASFKIKQLLLDSSENLYLTGINSDDSDLLSVLKIDGNGDVIWGYNFRIGSTEHRRITDLSAVLSPEGEPVIAVTEQHASLSQAELTSKCGPKTHQNSDCYRDENTARVIETGHKNITLLKINAKGEALWTKRYGAAYDESIGQISAAKAGGYLIGGRSDSLGRLGEGLLLRVDASGDIVTGCQLNQAATILSIVRNDYPQQRIAYQSVQSGYTPVITDSNYQQIDLPELVIARSCAGTAADPAGNNASNPTLTTSDLYITILGNGSVTSSPDGINCPGDCDHSYANGEEVQLLALPDPGWVFEKWSGDAGCGNQLTMDSASIGCVAEFRQLSGSNVTLTVVIKGGPGAGEVNSSELIPKMQCVNSNESKTSCTAVFQLGATVELLAQSYGVKNSIGWLGCDEFGGNICILGMNGNRTVDVTFSELTMYILNLNVTGGGRLITSDGKLDCAGGNVGTCSTSYIQGSTVIIEQAANNTQQLMNWSGDGTCANAGSAKSLPFTVSTDSQCNAEFTGPGVNEYSLCTRVVNETGSAVAGTVQRSASGRQDLNTSSTIDCQYYPSNSQITLTQQANPGFGFYRWDGFACYNNMLRTNDFNQPDTIIDLPPDISCNAVFRNDVNRLGVMFGSSFSQPGDQVISVRPSGSGSFTPYGSHICAGDCNEPVLTDVGQDAWLRAVPTSTPGNDTAGWQGCDELHADPDGGPMLCRIIFQQGVGEQKNVTVNFSHFAP